MGMVFGGGFAVGPGAAARAAVAGPEGGNKVPSLQCTGGDSSGEAGPGARESLVSRAEFRGGQRGMWTGRVRDARLGRVASSHRPLTAGSGVPGVATAAVGGKKSRR